MKRFPGAWEFPDLNRLTLTPDESHFPRKIKLCRNSDSIGIRILSNFPMNFPIGHQVLAEDDVSCDEVEGLFIQKYSSSKNQKKIQKIRKKPEKSEKNLKKSRDFLKDLKSVFESEKLFEFNVYVLYVYL